jgi:hypothetical protein
MNEYGFWRNRHEIHLVYPQTMKIVLYIMDPRLKASQWHGGQGWFF